MKYTLPNYSMAAKPMRPLLPSLTVLKIATSFSLPSTALVLTRRAKLANQLAGQAWLSCQMQVKVVA